MTPKADRGAQKEMFHELNGRQKIRYIWDYYKLLIAILCIGVYIAGFVIHRQVTHKDAVLYTALVNVAAGEDFTGQISEGFLSSQDIDRAQNQCELYTGLYLTKNTSSEYTYASRVKILGSISAKKLDVVLMDREAFDAFAEEGYLANLDTLLPEENPDLYGQLKPCLVSNTVILEDNAIESELDPSVEYSAETDAYPMAVDLSAASALVSAAGFDDTVYLGIIGNTPRPEMAVQYLAYLTGDASG